MIALATISIASGLFVVLTFQLTKSRIEANKQAALEQAVFAVLPEASVRKNYFLDTTGLELLSDESFAEANIFAGYDAKGELSGLAIEGSARGYQDIVSVLYGYSLSNESIIGITVLQSSETPGLGDKVETDPDFLANFVKLEASLNQDRTALENDIVTVKNGKKTKPWEIDGISGATVTSKAIGTALRESTNQTLPLLAKHKDSLQMTIPMEKGDE
ncbi:FMN-binding domain protein [Verrucomicrobiia bacterium DG1235]|nr:FMN-binding domain protein [Verrucomicrobiae bacterium DG1235]